MNPSQESRAPFLAQAVPRALALFLGVFSLLNLGGELLRRDFDSNFSWIDLRLLPALQARTLLVRVAVCLMTNAFAPIGTSLI